MDIRALVILRAPPVLRRDATGALDCADFRVGERAEPPAQGWANELVARWRGPGVESFCAINAAELKPGRPLTVHMDRLRLNPQLNTIVGHVTQMELAPLPPSWKRHAERTATGANTTPHEEPTP
jgi:hypothetical protein